ncbi:hypothetical protein Unana1_03771 [Umbelopsis nana]
MPQAVGIIKQTSLLPAAEYGLTEVVSVLLDDGVDIDSCAERGWTALHTACSASQIEVVRKLIERGANTEVREPENGRTPLFLAANDPAVMFLLIANGADIEARGSNGATALHYYSSIGQVNAIHFLLNYGCNIESIDEYGRTALHYAALQKQVSSVKILLDKGLDPNITKYYSGQTAFHAAVYYDNEPVMETLLQGGFDINCEFGVLKKTALFQAVEKNNVTLAKFLLDHGADVNAIDEYGQTTFHYAIDRNDFEMAKFLLTRGVRVNVFDKSGKSELDRAIERDNLRMVTLLVRSGASTKGIGRPIEGRLAQYLPPSKRRKIYRPTNAVMEVPTSTIHNEDICLFDKELNEMKVTFNHNNQCEIFTSDSRT